MKGSLEFFKFAKQKVGLDKALKFAAMFEADEKAWIELQEKTMPIIGFTDRDILRGKVVTPGWYRVRIDGVGEAPSKDGGSTNYPVEATILRNADDGSEDFASVPLDWNFNSKAIGFATGYLAALGYEIASNKRYDLANTAGKEIEVFVENDTYQGRLVNRVNHKYRPLRETVGA